MFAAAPSKVPYYVAGCLLALWAVLLAVWGISHHEFPGSPGRARLVMFTSLTLVAATMTAAVLTGGGEAEEEATVHATGRTLDLAADPGGAFKFDKTRAAVFAGRVTIRFTNDSTVQHNVTIAQGSKTLGATKTFASSTARLTLDLPAGDYVYYCSVPGHRESGMQGELTASQP